MALCITNEDCIQCDACLLDCPNGAVAADSAGYAIDPDRCTECAGHYDEPLCASNCPTGSIVFQLQG